MASIDAAVRLPSFNSGRSIVAADSAGIERTFGERDGYTAVGAIVRRTQEYQQPAARDSKSMSAALAGEVQLGRTPSDETVQHL